MPDGMEYATGAVVDPGSIALHTANRIRLAGHTSYSNGCIRLIYDITTD
jgi:hypothetical protein